LHEQVGVAERREPVVEGEKGTIGEVGFEDVAGGNRIGDARAGGKNAGLVCCIDGIAESNLDTKRARLLEQSTVEASGLAPPPNQVEERSPAVDGKPSAARVEQRAVRDRMVFEGRCDARRGEFVEHVRVVAPVFETLEIAVKAVPDLGMPLAHHDIPAGAHQCDRAGKASRPRADDGDGPLVPLPREPAVCKRAHRFTRTVRRRD